MIHLSLFYSKVSYIRLTTRVIMMYVAIAKHVLVFCGSVAEMICIRSALDIP